MIDNTNPISNFQPYRPVSAVPHTETPEHGVIGVLEKAGVDPAKVRNFRERVASMDARDWMNAATTFARSRPAMIVSGLVLAFIGTRLIRRRMM